MNHSVLKKIGLLFLIICLIGNFSASAQSQDDNHFIYIQAKNKKPFYVILNRKVFSSSSIGYLIIPKLQDGKYDLRIGFPKQDAPEQNYSCVISGSDMGFSLEKDNDGGLGLLNLQSKTFIASKGSTTLEDQYAGNTPQKSATDNSENVAKTKPVKANPNNVAFGQMLSGAINDPTLNKQTTNTQAENTQAATLPKQDQKTAAPVVVAEVNKQEQANVATDASQGSVSVSDLQDDSQTYGVIKSKEQMTNQGTQMTFVLFNSHSTDTVSVLVPQGVSQDKQVATSETVVAPSKKSSNDNSLALFSNTNGMSVEEQDVPVKKRKKKFVDISSNQSVEGSNTSSAKTVDNPFYNQSASKTDTTSVDDANVIDNNTATTPNCDNPLSDKDFSRMQKKMVAKSNDDDMIAIVDKYINGKCVTTQQVKQLGGLFLSDAGRFALFQDAYAHVSDRDNFATLQNQLLDQYFKSRFLKMLK